MATQQPTLLVVNAPNNVVIQNATVNQQANYVQLPGDGQTSSDGPQTRTKYDPCAIVIGVASILFLCAWIVWIFQCVSDYGVTTAFCQEPFASCDPARWNYTLTEVPACCIGSSHYQDYEKRCYKGEVGDYTCESISETIAPFVSQLLLIIFIVFLIYQLISGLCKGIQIVKQQQPSSDKKQHPLIQKVMNFIAAITLDFRKYAYKERETPQRSAIDLLWNSLLFLSIFRLIQDIPIILFNMLSTDYALRLAGKAKLYSDLLNVFLNFWAAASPVCNPFRGNCACNACFDVIFCQFTCGHFPQHHEPFVRAIGSIMRFTNVSRYLAAIAQIGAVGFIESSDQWHLVMASVNFVYGIITIVFIFKDVWTYYYLLCFYWSRYAVSKDENRTMQKVFSDWFVAMGIFKISIKEEDEFVTVLNSERTAPKLVIKSDMWVLMWGFIFFIVVTTWATGVWNCTKAFNKDFNSDYAHNHDNLCFTG